MFRFDFDNFAKGALNEIGDVLVSKAKANMDKVSVGRVYVIGGKAHIASKAGESPNNLSGALNNTIRLEIDKTKLEYETGNEKEDYAKWIKDQITQNQY